MSIFTDTDATDIVKYHMGATELLGKPMWVVTKPFEYRVGSLDSDDAVQVPEGFLTDGSSLPSTLLSYSTPWSTKGLAVIVHDWLSNKQVTEHKGIQVPVDYAFADKIFTEALSVLGVSKYRRIIVKVALILWRLFKAQQSGGDLALAKDSIEKHIRLNLQRNDTPSLTPIQVEELIAMHPVLNERMERLRQIRW